MAFLTMIAPLIAFTYPIDKIKDGTAQAFNKWLIEYLFNAILQPLHLLIYVVLVGTATNLITINPLYALVALAFISQAEKIMKDMFGLNKASTPPSPGAAMATGALASQAFNKIRGAGGSAANALGSGKSGGGSGGTEKSKIRQSKGLEAYAGSNNSSNSGSDKKEDKTRTVSSTDSKPDSMPEGRDGDYGSKRLPDEEIRKLEGNSNPREASNSKTDDLNSTQPKHDLPKERVKDLSDKKQGRVKSVLKAGGKALGRNAKKAAIYTGKKAGRGAIRAAAMAPGLIVGGAMSLATGQVRYLTAGAGLGAALGTRATNKIVKAPKAIRTAYRKERLGTSGAEQKERLDTFLKDKDNLKYIREQHPEIKNDREAKKRLQDQGADFIKAGYTNVEDVNRLMSMRESAGPNTTADQIMAADQMASKVKYDDLMDEGKSKKLEATIANQIQTTAAQKGKSMTKEEAEKHAQKHMNLMRAAHGIPSISEKAQTRQENPQEKTEQKTPTKTPSKNKNGKNKGKAKHEKNAKSAQRKAKRKASNKQKKG